MNMTAEEKAKAYDEALEKAKDCLKDGTITSTAIDYIETIFPELKESEDERIRKSIICGMNALKEQGKETFATIPINDCIAWLEKQGERKQEWSEEDDAYKELAICAVANFYDEENPLNKCIVNWLKSLKDKIKEN